MEENSNTFERPDPQRTVVLECPFCSRRTTIRVDRKRWLPGILPWECFDCQREDRRFSSLPGYSRA